MLVSDLRHFLDLPDEVPGSARRLGEQLGDIVRAGTAGDVRPAWQTACRAGGARAGGPARAG